MKPLIKYEAARAAVAAAHRVDEVKDIRNRAEAARAYARQANDTEMLMQATEIKERASRRAAELYDQMEKNHGAIGGPGPGRGKKNAVARRDRVLTPPTLADLGVTKQQMSRWRKLADLSERDFEATLDVAKEHAASVVARPINKKPKKKKRVQVDEVEDDSAPGDDAQTIWRRGLVFRAQEAISLAKYEDWGAHQVDEALVAVALQAADAWSNVAKYLKELHDG